MVPEHVLQECAEKYQLHHTFPLDARVSEGPSAMAGLLKYMEVVRDLARSNGDWVTYDTKFRKMQMQQKLGCGVSHHELYFRALCGVKNMNERNRDYVKKNYVLKNMSMSSIPTWYCVRFHTGSTCFIYLVNTVMFVIYITVRVRHPDVGMQELLGQTFSFRNPSPHSTILGMGAIFVPKGYQILDIGPVSVNDFIPTEFSSVQYTRIQDARSQVSNALNGALSFPGLSTQRYKGHSFVLELQRGLGK